MKSLVIIISICINCALCFSQSTLKKQTLIPLNNINGVPYYKDKELNDLGIDGFEVDDKGNLYFLGGDNSICLAAFSSNNKPLYRKIYKDFHPRSLYIVKNVIYTFFLGNSGVNDLISMNLSNGEVIARYSNLSKKNIASYTFNDKGIVIGTVSIESSSFYQYDFKGHYSNLASNCYDLPAVIIPGKIEQSEWEFLGKWNENFIFWNTNPGSKFEKLCVVDRSGKILKSKLLPYNFSGDGYVSNPPEDRKVRNGSLYVLGRKGNFALITEVPLKEFFDK